jgi:hypothetical protein
MQHLTDRLRLMAEQMTDMEDARTIMYAVNHIEAARSWKIRWAEADEKLQKLHAMHDKLLREYNEYRRQHGD